uniref:3-ketoacyl-CoA synthase n=1 Tax=Kalanchoe fedtschenkoi TaxID=63787 RepID=A0A7N0UZK1_KALFE
MIKQVFTLIGLFIISLVTIQTLPNIYNSISKDTLSPFILLTLTPLAIFLLNPYYFSSPQIYMVDFSCFKPPSHCKAPFARFIEASEASGTFSKETIATMSKILHMSGISQETYLPPSIFSMPPKPDHKESVDEAHTVLFTSMSDLLSKTRVLPQEIDILIVNCCYFCTSPSFSSIIINKFKLREDVKSYTLSGMGCSASIAAVDLAKNLLTVHNGQNAVVLSTEIISQTWYPGNDPSMLTINCLFRMGGAAILLTNKPQLKHMSKYKLLLSLRTQIASVDAAYNSSQIHTDSNGIDGFRVQRGLMKIVSQTLIHHIKALAPRILPVRETLRYMISSFLPTKLIPSHKTCSSNVLYVPNFKTAVDHFMLPTSGKAWVKTMGKGLGLDEWDVEPTLMTLRRFGNQSSSSIWYVLAYIEAKGRVKEGDRLLQLMVGTGMKCCSAVWECVRSINGEAETGPWADCIDRYPEAMSGLTETS